MVRLIRPMGVKLRKWFSSRYYSVLVCKGHRFINREIVIRRKGSSIFGIAHLRHKIIMLRRVSKGIRKERRFNSMQAVTPMTTRGVRSHRRYVRQLFLYRLGNVYRHRFPFTPAIRTTRCTRGRGRSFLRCVVGWSGVGTFHLFARVWWGGACRCEHAVGV